jgi:hypothetical protein
MNDPEKTAGRGRPPRCGTESHFKMTVVDIDRIARAIARMPRDLSVREAYIVHFATLYATSGHSAEGAGTTVVLAPANERPSYSQFRYWASKIRRADKP